MNTLREPLLLAVVTAASLTSLAPAQRVGSGLSSAQAGWSVAFLGDVDGDGSSESVMGAPFANGTAGAIEFGDHQQGAVLATATNGVVGDGFGFAMATGDVNGDGVADLAVSAPWAGDLSYVEILDGSLVAGRLAGGTSVINIASVRIVRLPAPGPVVGATQFGFSIDLGDMDGDGLAELIVGDPAQGAIHCYRGTSLVAGTTVPVSSVVGASPQGGMTLGGYGHAVKIGVDLNADLTAEVAIGAPETDGVLFTDHGYFEVLSGANLLLNLPPVLVCWWSGAQSGIRFGHAIAWTGVTNGSQPERLMVGAPGGGSGVASSWGGMAFLFDGISGAFVASVTSSGGAPGSWFGASIVSIPNTVVGSGFRDFLIGEPFYGATGGRLHLVDGQNGGASVLATGPIFGAGVSNYGFSLAVAEPDANVFQGVSTFTALIGAPSATGAVDSY